MATITSIPIGSNLFSTQHTAKKLTKPKPSNTEAVSSDSPTIPTTLAPAPPSTPFHHPPYAPFPPSPYVYPPYYPFTLPIFWGPPSFKHGGPSNWKNQPPQPPSSPLPATEYSVDEFCEAYDISFAACTKLDQLGFKMGDDLSFISEAQYESVGFKHLEWVMFSKHIGNSNVTESNWYLFYSNHFLWSLTLLWYLIYSLVFVCCLSYFDSHHHIL